MSDFNTMFDEQMMAQDYSDGSYRILEAMLKRDNLEIQYRKQGYSESQIAQFHEAATAQINEAMSDRWAQAKGAMSRGWGKVKAAGKWIWQKIKEMWAKFVAFLKKVWMKIRNLFSEDEDFAKRYERTILADASIKYYNDHDIKIKLLPVTDPENVTIPSGKTKEVYEDLASKFYSANLDGQELPATKENVRRAIGTVIAYRKDVGKNAVARLTAAADAKQKEIDKFEKGNMSEEEAKKKVESLAEELKATRAAANYVIRFYKKAHSLAKAAIIHLASKVKAVKESTIAFMIESATSELDREYAPILEATDDKKLEYRKWDSGKGFKGKMGVIWDNIKMFFKKMWNWITTKVKAAWVWIKKQWEKVKAWWKKDGKKKDPDKKVEAPKNNAPIVKKATDLLLNPKATPDQIEQAIPGVRDAAKEAGEKVRMDEMFNRIEITGRSLYDVENALKEFNRQLDSAQVFTKNVSLDDDEEEIMNNRIKALQEKKRLASALIELLKNDMTKSQEAVKINHNASVEANKQSMGYDGLDDAAIDNLMSDIVLESYELMAEADAVDDVIGSAVGNGYGIDDVNHSSLDVLGSASTDPFALDYEKTNTFSQTVDMGDEGTAGWVDSRIGDTTTHVGSGLETPSVTKEAYELNDDFRELDSMLYGYAY